MERLRLSQTSAAKVVCSQPMQPVPRPSFDPVGAGALLTATTGAGIGLGTLVGWASGSVGYGVMGGAVVGLPCGVAAVYHRYRGSL